MINFKVVSIDAWRDFGGWDYNDVHQIGMIQFDPNNITTRKLLKILRNEGFLPMQLKGKLRVEKYPTKHHYWEIQNKNTFEPILYIEESDINY